MTLIKGQKGRFPLSGREFEITNCEQSAVTRIRFRFEREDYDIPNADLRDSAINISYWDEPTK